MRKTHIDSITFGGTTWENVEIVLGNYGPGYLAVQLEVFDPEWGFYEPLTTVSVNLEAYRYTPAAPDAFFVKDYSENAGILAALQSLGVIEILPVSPVNFGWANSLIAHQARLTGEYALEPTKI